MATKFKQTLSMNQFSATDMVGAYPSFKWGAFIIAVFCVAFESKEARGQGYGDLRLTDGTGFSSSSLTSGRLEIFTDSGQWGSVCNATTFGANESSVACHQLGYASVLNWGLAVDMGLPSIPGQPIGLQGVSCSTSQYLHIKQCSQTSDLCDHTQDIALSCDSEPLWMSQRYPGTLRLQGGNSISHGRVEILFNGQWGTICSTGIGIVEATTMCRQLGYMTANDYGPGGSQMYRNSSTASQPIWLVDVSCFTFSNCLSSCVKIPRLETTACTHDDDIILQCAYQESDTLIPNTEVSSCNNFTSDYSTVPSNGELRLVGLESRIGFGRLEMFLSGHWSTFCTENFGMKEADIVCHQLGFNGSVSYVLAVDQSFGKGVSDTILEVSCDQSYSELHLLWCTVSVSTCNHSDDVAIQCSENSIWENPYEGQVRVLGSHYPSKGGVEIFFNGRWEVVCQSSFGENEANSVCRQLGYTHSEYYNSLTLPPLPDSDFLFSDGDCRQSEACFTSCFSQSRVEWDCVSNEPATVQCSFDEYSRITVGDQNLCEFIDTGYTRAEFITIVSVCSVVGGIGLIITILYLCYCFYKVLKRKHAIAPVRDDELPTAPSPDVSLQRTQNAVFLGGGLSLGIANPAFLDASSNANDQSTRIPTSHTLPTASQSGHVNEDQPTSHTLPTASQSGHVNDDQRTSVEVHSRSQLPPLNIEPQVTPQSDPSLPHQSPHSLPPLYPNGEPARANNST